MDTFGSGSAMGWITFGCIAAAGFMGSFVPLIALGIILAGWAMMLDDTNNRYQSDGSLRPIEKQGRQRKR